MGWEFVPPFDAGARAALAAGKPLVYVCPPVAWAAGPLFAAAAPATDAGSTRTIVVAPEADAVAELAGVLNALPQTEPALVGMGTARTARLLRRAPARTLVATATDLVALLTRSTLDLAGLAKLVIAWPEHILAAEAAPALETVLQEARAAQRAVITADPHTPALTDFLERHAHRAVTVSAAVPPTAPVGAARFAVVEPARRPWAVRAALDGLDPASVAIWDPMPATVPRWRAIAPDARLLGVDDGEQAALAIATTLPTAEILVELTAAATEVLVFVRAEQVAYLRRLARPLRALRLPGESDRARERGARLRERLRERLAEGALDAELLALGPLFEEWDPALVAAAAVASAERPAAEPVAGPLVAWVRLHLNVGRRDGLRPADVVGALLNSVGLAKTHVGRVEIRDAFTLVEVRQEDAARALRGLTGVTLRGRRIAARPDERGRASGGD